jgi:hypothetical protein
MSKVHLYLERFWLVIGCLAAIVTTIYMIQDGFDKTKIFWLLTGVAFAMYFMRRGVRKRLEKHAKSMGSKKK